MRSLRPSAASRPQIVPFLERAVAASEPHQGDEIDLLVVAQGVDEAGDLARHRDRRRRPSSTSIMSSSAPFDPESGSEAPSLTSNSLRLLDQKADFLGEIVSSGIASLLLSRYRNNAECSRDDPLRRPAETSIFRRQQTQNKRKRRMHWNVGKVKITKVVELETVGSTRFILPLATNEEIQKLPWLIPHFATEEGRLKMSIHSLVVETPSRRIIVDTGLGNDKQGRNVPTWNNRKDPFLETLTAAGFPPDSIDTVLCTHLHVDHVGWNTRLVDGKWVPTFANARYVFGRTEYRALARPQR